MTVVRRSLQQTADYGQQTTDNNHGQRTTDNGPRTNYGQLALWAFHVALLTGVILSFHYRPWGDVFKSVSKISGWLPYGDFLRKLHYLAGQCFLILSFAHVLEHFLKETYRRIRPKEWSRLVLLFSLGFPLLFTGFILKGDKEGILAGEVMYHLAQEIPLIGSGLARMLLRPGEEFFLLPYLYHTVILPLTVIFLLDRHTRRLLPRGDWGWPFMAFLALLATFFPLPPDIPPYMEISHISGPWFFHGVQLLLRQVPPLWAGVIWPVIPLLLTALLPFAPPKLSKWGKRLTMAAWLIHGMILVAAWL
ncbi:cytochrome b N-terminal domain-containing protein [Desulfobacterales bacterium HSG2]|nr:cytochrome b N-terminal domain-containing protein [Desulfobacterales bacterium HSG2]